MTVNISVLASNAAGDAIVNLLDGGSSNPNGFMEIRTGTKPANTLLPATGTLLAVLNFSNPAFGDFSNSSALANAISPDVDIDADGTAGWFRCYDRDGVAIFDGDITITGGGGDIEFDTINFLAGGTVQITTLSGTMSL